MNDSYAFGLDFYEGNSVRDWSILNGWSMKPAYAYFRAGIGLHKDNLSLYEQAASAIQWQLGFYYEVWLPDVPKAEQAATFQAQLNLIGVNGHVHLPPALAFEEQTELDRQGHRLTAFPSVGDLSYLVDTIAGSIVYTNEAGLIEIKRVLGSIPANWKFWIAYYGAGVTGVEADVAAAIAMAAKYGIDKSRIYFVQTTPTGAYPQGASFDKGADYNRAVSYPIGQTTPVVSGNQFLVTAAQALNIRSTPDTSNPNNIVGFLQHGDTVMGSSDGQFVHLDGYIASAFVQPVSANPPPAPVPLPTPAPVPPPAPAPVGTFYRVLHDFQSADTDFLPRMLQRGSSLDPQQGTAECVNMDDSLRVDLPKEWQLFIYAALRDAAPASMSDDQIRQHAYLSLLGTAEAFCNFTGYPQAGRGSPKADFVNGRDEASPLPAYDRTRTCGGNIVKVLDEHPVMLEGVPHLKVECLNIHDAPPDITKDNYRLVPWHWCIAVICYPYQLPNGEYRVGNFPHLAGNAEVLPVISTTGFGYIRQDRLVKVDSPFGTHATVP